MTIPALTVGLFLNKLMDQVGQAIVDARNAGLNLEVEAGREVSLAIQNAKNAYANSLNETMDHINRTVRQTLDQLSSMVQEVQNRNEATLTTTAARVQQFINTLPFAHLQPQVTNVTPKYMVPSTKSYDVMLKFFGNFVFASKKECTPGFSIRGTKFVPIGNTTQELNFSVPSSILFPPNSVDPTKISVITGDLTLPWLKEKWAGLKHTKETDTYKVLLGALPSSPGKITFQYKTARLVTEKERFVQGGFHLASTREAGNNDQKDVPFTVTPHSGWHVVRGSSKIENFGGQGEYTFPSFVSDDGDRVTYKATTIHKSAGSSGSMDFSIGFDEYREVTVQDPQSQNIDIKWGDSIVLEQPAEGWRIIFQAFDGTHSEFGGADLSNPYLKIKNEGGKIVVATADPSTLSLPSNRVAPNLLLKAKL